VREVPVARVRSLPGPNDVVDDGIDGSEGLDASDTLDDDAPIPELATPSARFAGAFVPQMLQ
jgi:hypothetical protein